MFTCVLNQRISKWCEENNTISDAQFGFRKGRSTVDAVFVLHSIIENYVNSTKRLYYCFVDMKRCFDSIYLNALWLKLYKANVDGKVLRIIRSMYQSVKSCVRHCENYSDYFNIAVGLRQGEIISPILFSLFVEDIEMYLQNRNSKGIVIQDMCLILLLFADDMVVIGETPEDLQLSIDHLHNYCETWGLEVNTAKTKVVVFRKRGGLKHNEKWIYADEYLDVVNDFNYLGVTLNYTGNFNLNSQTLYGKGLKALNNLLSNLKKYECKPRVALQLVDAFVSPIITYGCEVWGFTKSSQLERLHLKFCKATLGVRQSTANVAVYGELGRYPLYINRYVRIITYWLKLKDSDNIITKSVVKDAVCDVSINRTNWFSKVKNLLTRYGFYYVWCSDIPINTNKFICTFRQRLLDEYLQQWQENVTDSGVLTLYKTLNMSHGFESYLDLIVSRDLRVVFTKLRICSHNLRIHTGRYEKLDRHLRICQICSTNEIEDEFHLMFKCTAYAHLRPIYLKHYYRNRPSMFKLIQLFNTNNKSELFMLSKYISEAFKIRNVALTDL